MATHPKSMERKYDPALPSLIKTANLNEYSLAIIYVRTEEFLFSSFLGGWKNEGVEEIEDPTCIQVPAV